MLIVGVTGGIGAGKSEVCKVFKKLGAKVVSADQIGKEVVEKNPALLRKLVKVFGPEILNSDGTLNRRKLGKKAFSSQEAKIKLNKIVHPYLLLDLKKNLEELKRKKSLNVTVVDAALIIEWGLEKKLDFLIYVYSPRKTRLQRLIEKQGYSFREALDRMKSQLPELEKKRKADFIIQNDSDLETLYQKTKEQWNNILAFRRKSPIGTKKIDKKN